jgi:hypothetical protein
MQVSQASMRWKQELDTAGAINMKLHSKAMIRLTVLASFALTLTTIQLMDDSLLAAAMLPPMWFLLLRPLHRAEWILFVLVGVFFVGQNYAVLSAGGFAFRQKDILLMPYYEPLLWGYWFLNISRFAAEPSGQINLHWRAFLGVVVTAAMFTVLGANSDHLLWGTLVSSALLLVLFHEAADVRQGLYAMALGFAIEYFGVSQGFWSYPHPDILGMPYWFATMWFSIGILGRRFVQPLAQWLARQTTATQGV